MKKILSLALAGSVVTLAACSTPIPECKNADMDKCGHGTVYSEERTEPVGIPAAQPVAPAPVVAPPPPAPAPVPAPAPAPEPAPAPADTTIMKQAPEPDLTK